MEVDIFVWLAATLVVGLPFAVMMYAIIEESER